ncbi:putative nucleotidyltransferase substrate binding domain-containing protein [Corynebacterium comes]|nr:putative nucleotidyltransferase substrate binding domain-containing protein [Corynebacterium comes]
MLHPSLRDLAEQAPLSTTTATARGVLVEAQQLLRNALEHRTPETLLTGWFSDLVLATLDCPAVVGKLSSPVTPTGPFARGDALPTSAVTWFAEADADTTDLKDLLTSAGLSVGGPPTDEVELLAARVDAHLITPATPPAELLRLAVSHRPPALRALVGLPAPDVAVDVTASLLRPIADVARWAAPGERSTLERLAAGHNSGLLTEDEAEALSQAWETGVALQFRRWVDRVDSQPTTLGDLPALHRSAYGAAARQVSGVLRSLAGRHGITLS